jgi:hypothetical protein
MRASLSQVVAVVVMILLAAGSCGFYLGAHRDRETGEVVVLRPHASTGTPVSAPRLATAVPTATMAPAIERPEVTATVPPSVVFVGESVSLQADGQPFAVSISNYAEADACPGGAGQADPGAKLVIVWVLTENVGDDYASLPDLDFVLASGDRRVGRAAGEAPCEAAADEWTTACSAVADGGLWPGSSCEGWQVLQVPEAADVSDLQVEAFAQSPTAAPLARWRLAAPG